MKTNQLSSRDRLIKAIKAVWNAVPDTETELQPDMIRELILAGEKSLRQGIGIGSEALEECIAIGTGMAKDIEPIAQINEFLKNIDADEAELLQKLDDVRQLRESALANKKASIIVVQKST